VLIIKAKEDYLLCYEMKAILCVPHPTQKCNKTSLKLKTYWHYR